MNIVIRSVACHDQPDRRHMEASRTVGIQLRGAVELTEHLAVICLRRLNLGNGTPRISKSRQPLTLQKPSSSTPAETDPCFVGVFHPESTPCAVILLKTKHCPFSQAGRQGFESHLPLQEINNLAKPVPLCTPLYSISEPTAMFRAGSLPLCDP